MLVRLHILIRWTCSTHDKIITAYKSGILMEARTRNVKV